MEGERIGRHPELAAHVYWMISDVRQQLALDFAARLGIGERSPRACVLANVVVDIATYTMEESFERERDPGDIFLAALDELRPLLDRLGRQRRCRVLTRWSWVRRRPATGEPDRLRGRARHASR